VSRVVVVVVVVVCVCIRESPVRPPPLLSPSAFLIDSTHKKLTKPYTHTLNRSIDHPIQHISTPKQGGGAVAAANAKAAGAAVWQENQSAVAAAAAAAAGRCRSGAGLTRLTCAFGFVRAGAAVLMIWLEGGWGLLGGLDDAWNKEEGEEAAGGPLCC
jgi:hypothetical protein